MPIDQRQCFLILVLVAKACVSGCFIRASAMEEEERMGLRVEWISTIFKPSALRNLTHGCRGRLSHFHSWIRGEVGRSSDLGRKWNGRCELHVPRDQAARSARSGSIHCSRCGSKSNCYCRAIPRSVQFATSYLSIRTAT